MHQIIIVLNTGNTNFILSFKDYNKAVIAHEEITKKWMDTPYMVSAMDDYGHVLNISAGAIAACMLTDVAKEDMSNVDREILKQRAAKNYNDRINNDPILNLTVPGANLNRKLSS